MINGQACLVPGICQILASNLGKKVFNHVKPVTLDFMILSWPRVSVCWLFAVVLCTAIGLPALDGSFPLFPAAHLASVAPVCAKTPSSDLFGLACETMKSAVIARDSKRQTPGKEERHEKQLGKGVHIMSRCRKG